uniref:Transcriptional repressor TUP1 n=1 Tax=Ganoderma boninense TaxID=34458 RepID=A0A5K1K5X6_9APHY|nr:Transcriptional repressor TUP1 [Ganoderma boninense]
MNEASSKTILADALAMGRERQTVGRANRNRFFAWCAFLILGRLASDESAVPSPILPASTNAAAPPAEPAVPPSPVTVSASPASDFVDDAPVSVPSLPDADSGLTQKPASALSESSPSIRPIFAAFLEEAALLERSRALTDYASGAADPVLVHQRPSRVSSSSWGGFPQVDCGHPECIRDMHRLRWAFSKAGLAYHPAMRDVYRALRAAYRLLYACQWDRMAVLIRDFFVELRDAESPSM